MVTVQCHHSFDMDQLALQCKGELSLLLCLCIYILMDHACLSFSVSYNTLMSFFISMFKMSQIWPARGPPSWLLCPFGRSPSFLEHFLVFWHHKMLQAHLVLSLPQPWSQPFFPRRPGNAWLTMASRNQDLGTKCYSYVFGVCFFIWKKFEHLLMVF